MWRPFFRGHQKSGNGDLDGDHVNCLLKSSCSCIHTLMRRGWCFLAHLILLMAPVSVLSEIIDYSLSRDEEGRADVNFGGAVTV